mmetsp:Transcript_10032/g.22625  ORF Transcript_10032/g.22625 Transcript_10032/m.22625 type:complete len:330 (+) Transcript_10032:343-1332(+)
MEDVGRQCGYEVLVKLENLYTRLFTSAIHATYRFHWVVFSTAFAVVASSTSRHNAVHAALTSSTASASTAAFAGLCDPKGMLWNALCSTSSSPLALSLASFCLSVSWLPPTARRALICGRERGGGGVDGVLSASSGSERRTTVASSSSLDPSAAMATSATLSSPDKACARCAHSACMHSTAFARTLGFLCLACVSRRMSSASPALRSGAMEYARFRRAFCASSMTNFLSLDPALMRSCRRSSDSKWGSRLPLKTRHRSAVAMTAVLMIPDRGDLSAFASRGMAGVMMGSVALGWNFARRRSVLHPLTTSVHVVDAISVVVCSNASASVG